MGITQQTNLDVANTTVTTAVNSIFKPDTAETWKQYTAPIQCAGTSLEIVVVDGLPRVRERIGPLQHKHLRAYRKNLTYRSWEATYDLPAIMVEQDQSGAVGQRISEFTSTFPMISE